MVVPEAAAATAAAQDPVVVDETMIVLLVLVQAPGVSAHRLPADGDRASGARRVIAENNGVFRDRDVAEGNGFGGLGRHG